MPKAKAKPKAAPIAPAIEPVLAPTVPPAPEPVPVVAREPEVLVFTGYAPDGAVLTASVRPDTVPGVPFIDRLTDIHIAGEAYVHIDEAPDGTWIYAHRDAKARPKAGTH